MSAWADLREGIRRAILMQERVERLSGGIQKVEEQLLNHDRRLVRIETMIEIAQQGPLAKRSSEQSTD